MKTVTPLIDPDTGKLDPEVIPSGGSSGPETDPVFSSWKTTEYDSRSVQLESRVSSNEQDIANRYTKTEIDALQTAQTQTITAAYNSAISIAIGNLQAQGLTQDQINQIINAMPDIDAVSQANLDTAIANVLTEANGYTDAQITNVKAELNAVIQRVQDALDSHKSTDRFRWQDVYNDMLQSIIRDAKIDGLMPDPSGGYSAPVDEAEHVVDLEYGGVIGISFRNENGLFTVVKIDGSQVYSSDGLTEGVVVTKYYWLKNGDTFQATNATAFNFIPFVPDENSTVAKLIESIADTNARIDSQNNVILDIKASLQNKILDPDPTHVVNIEDSQYTVSSTLGGRLNGTGYTLLGLLGIRTVSTGTVEVTYTNGETVLEYDNRSLLAVGPAQPFTLDVGAGDVVVSSSMGSLTVTPYIGGE